MATRQKLYLDDEERDLIESVERGEWKSVKNLRQEINKHQQYARNTLRCSGERTGGRAFASLTLRYSGAALFVIRCSGLKQVFGFGERRMTVRSLNRSFPPVARPSI